MHRSSRGRAYRLCQNLSTQPSSQVAANLSIIYRRFRRIYRHPQGRKDIELSPSGLPRCGSSLRKLKDFAPPFSSNAVIARCSPFAATPQAPLRSSFRQRAFTAMRSELSSRHRFYVKRSSILWFAARRKGIARTLRSTLTALPPPRKEHVSIHAQKTVAALARTLEPLQFLRRN